MSIHLLTKAFKARVGNQTRKLILIKLADSANDDGWCFPSYSRIARDCEVDRSTVIRHVNILIEMGVISKQHRFVQSKNHEKWENTSNVFLFNFDVLDSIQIKDDKPSKNPDSPQSQPAITPVAACHHPSGTVRPPLVAQCDPEPSPLTVTEPSSNLIPPPKQTITELFDLFWAAYPKKAGKVAAVSAWSKRIKTIELAYRVIEDVKLRKINDGNWQDVQYIPHASTYLNGERWEDDMIPLKSKTAKSSNSEFYGGIFRDQSTDDGGLIIDMEVSNG